MTTIEELVHNMEVLARRKIANRSERVIFTLLEEPSTFAEVRAAIREAYRLGLEQGAKSAENEKSQFSVRRINADRYAKVRDLMARGINPVALVEFVNDINGTTVQLRVRQGEVLDRWLDSNVP